eukprot:613965-Lingulodinium_polyedra.AAC.1
MRKELFEGIASACGGWGALERRAFLLAVGTAPGAGCADEPSDLFEPAVLAAARGSLERWLSRPGGQGEGVDLAH